MSHRHYLIITEAPKYLLQLNSFGSVKPYGVYRIKRTPCWQQLFNPVAPCTSFITQGKDQNRVLQKMDLNTPVLDITHDYKENTTGITFSIKCSIITDGRCHKIHISCICIIYILKTSKALSKQQPKAQKYKTRRHSPGKVSKSVSSNHSAERQPAYRPRLNLPQGQKRDSRGSDKASFRLAEGLRSRQTSGGAE